MDDAAAAADAAAPADDEQTLKSEHDSCLLPATDNKNHRFCHFT